MRDTLPPLKAVHAFEVAAKHMSFSKAASVLLVTPGAVSRQISLLEDWLGVALFERRHREVRLTLEGMEYYRQVAQSLQTIRAATSHITEKKNKAPLHIWCSQTFAMRWLLPRMSDFYTKCPNHDITVTTTMKPVDFSATDADVAVRLGVGNWPRTVSHKIASITLAPVCSPGFLKAAGGLRSPSDLAHHTLLFSMARPDDWSEWLQAAGLEMPGSRSIELENSMLAYQAAVAGLGVVVAQLELVVDELRKGLLVQPFEHVLKDNKSFYLIYPETRTHSPSLLDFKNWLLSQR